MKKTIYNTYIRVTSQGQCDRLKQVCIENDLKVWDTETAFDFNESLDNFFSYDGYDFAVYNIAGDSTEVTESEWMELLKKKPLPLQHRIDKALEYLESFNEGDRNEYLINILRHGKRMD